MVGVIIAVVIGVWHVNCERNEKIERVDYRLEFEKGREALVRESVGGLKREERDVDGDLNTGV